MTERFAGCSCVFREILELSAPVAQQHHISSFVLSVAVSWHAVLHVGFCAVSRCVLCRCDAVSMLHMYQLVWPDGQGAFRRLWVRAPSRVPFHCAVALGDAVACPWSQVSSFGRKATTPDFQRGAGKAHDSPITQTSHYKRSAFNAHRWKSRESWRFVRSSRVNSQECAGSFQGHSWLLLFLA